MMTEIGMSKDALDTPALWVDLAMLEHNVRTLGDYFRQAGTGWRPHIKGIKVPAIAHLALAAGALGVTCAKVSEAEVMAAAGIDDVLIANQVVTTPKIDRLVQLRRQVDVKVAADDPDNVEALGRAAVAHGVRLGVLVEVDIGLRRAGVTPGRPAVDLAQQIATTPGLRFAGLMAWEGHARAEMDLAARRLLIEGALDGLIDSVERCHAAGLPCEIVSAGGTGTFYVTAHRQGMTEIQAGGAIFGEVMSQAWQVGTQPALFVRATVTSRPARDRIVVDAGFKALPAWHATPQPLGLADVVSHHTSAEHATLTLGAPDDTLRVGDGLDFLVGYGDETVCLHDTMYGVRGGAVEVVWPIAGRGKMR